MTDKEPSISVLTFGGGADHWRNVAENAASNVVAISCPDRHQLATSYAGVNCLVGWAFPDSIYERLPDLEWIQNLTVGVDPLINNPSIAEQIRITNVGGLYGDSIGEYVIWAMLSLFRRFHHTVRNQERRRWHPEFGDGLSGKRIGIVGMGDVGGKVAQMASAFGMQVTALTRDGTMPAEGPPVHHCEPSNRLSGVVAELDALILCLPLTEASRGMVNAAVVANMKSTAIVVNVSRAPLIDGTVVSDAVANGRLAGAALDVFDKEPLSRWSRLWKVPNLLVTPHTAALSSQFKTRVADLITENMLRFQSGRPLLNEVDRSKGY